MSACDRACVISFVAAGKHTYLFGDLLKDRVSDSASDSSSKLLPQEIFECAEKYYKHPEGLLPWADRPVLLKKGILAKIPPI